MAKRPLDTTLEAASAGGGVADLLLIAGPGHLTTRKLDQPTLVIGRAPACDVAIDHRALSQRHALLQVRPLTIRDLGSTNGTACGGVRRTGGAAVALAAGDSFHIGPFSFLLVGAGVDDGARSSADAELVVDDPTPAGISELVRSIAISPASVLILGETGVGKDMLAETLHALSGRTGPLCRINCAALSESLLESELFGHEKGAFTGAGAAHVGLFEAADGGSVFLDEVGELAPSIQAKLLRAVEAREILRLGSTRPIAIDVRFIAATNRDLQGAIAAGRFRRDLYFRLDGVTLRVPPLRSRPGAIGGLALGFVEEASRRAGRAARVQPGFVAALEAHAWPGNVRELKAVMERAVLLSRGGDLAPVHLAFASGGGAEVAAPPPVADPADGLEDSRFLSAEQRADRQRVIAALDQCAGNQTRAARMLGLARTTLINKIALYRIPRPRT